MIESFATAETKTVFEGKFVKKLPRDMQSSAYRKLLMLDSIKAIKELQLRPALRCEKLQGRLKYLWSIRINDQWRIVFSWEEERSAASAVEIVDYH